MLLKLLDIVPNFGQWGGDMQTDTQRSLRRSRSNRMVAGVIAGIANYMGIDVTLARVIYVVVSALSAAFPGLLVYVLLWLVIPEGE
jgi:phage shock protein C